MEGFYKYWSKTFFVNFLGGVKVKKKTAKIFVPAILMASLAFSLSLANASTEVVKQISPKAAWQRLIDGNKRFSTGKLSEKHLGKATRAELTKGQKPYAIVVSCSDSRVPPELVFDEGLGELFVIRVAGNVVDPIALGSIEYAVEHIHSPIIVVMGHEKCGAVTATAKGGEAPGSIGSIVEKIKPSLSLAKLKGVKEEHELIEQAAKENVLLTIKDIKASPIVKEALEKNDLKIIGAKYDLDTGKIAWFK